MALFLIIHIYIYIYMGGHGEKFQGKKPSIYKWVIYYFTSNQKIKYFNSIFTKIFVSKMVSKVFNKNFGEKKLLNILFSIKMENNIYNSLSTEVFVSPCDYKLII